MPLLQVGGHIAAGSMVDLRGMRIHGALLQLWGEGAMYKGIGPVLLRAAPVHMAYLPVYDYVFGQLEKFPPSHTDVPDAERC